MLRHSTFDGRLMGHVLLGGAIGLISALGCALLGDITWGEAALIYWIIGSISPVLHVALGANTPAAARCP